MKTMKKSFRIFLIISFFLLMLWGLLSYALRPLHYQKNIFACTLDGNVLKVEFDVTLYRHLGKPIESHGRIIIDNVEYISINDLYPKESLKNISSHIFLIPSQYALDEWENDKIFLNPIDNHLDYFMLSFVKSETAYTYFGPASSQAEAWTVAGQTLCQ